MIVEEIKSIKKTSSPFSLGNSYIVLIKKDENSPSCCTSMKHTSSGRHEDSVIISRNISLSFCFKILPLLLQHDLLTAFPRLDIAFLPATFVLVNVANLPTFFIHQHFLTKNKQKN